MKKVICKTCGKELNLCEKNFGKEKKNRSGFKGSCKKCIAKYKKEHSEKNKENIAKKQKEHYENNRKEIIENSKKYYESNKEKTVEYKKEHYEKNKIEIAKKHKENYEKNKEELLKKSKEHSKEKAKHLTYKDQLFADEAREADNNILEVKCKHCKEWFKPANSQVKTRINAINGKARGENHFYCSEECKDNCEVYGKKPSQLERLDEINAGIYKIHKHEGFYTQDQLNIWSKQVRDNANNECERCGSKENLQAHHVLPKSEHPEQALEPDNGVCLCIECHKEAHSQDGCRTGQLRKCEILENSLTDKKNHDKVHH